jgi:hypothetical protein
MFYGICEDYRGIDDILVPIMTSNGYEAAQYRKISESEKAKVTDRLITGALNLIRSKSSSIDFSGIEMSEGDIERVPGFKDLEASIALLGTLFGKTGGPNEARDLAACLSNLRRGKSSFQNGFRENNELIKLLYDNVVVSLIGATSFIVATSVEYTRDGLNLFKVGVRKAAAQAGQSGQMDLALANVRNFNRFADRGKIQTFIDAVSREGSEGCTGIEIFAGITLAVVAVIAIVYLIKSCIYWYFCTRKAAAKQLELLAAFVEMNATQLSGSALKVRTRQEDIAKRLRRLADAVSLDSKVGNRQAKQDLSQDNDEDRRANPLPAGGVV